MTAGQVTPGAAVAAPTPAPAGAAGRPTPTDRGWWVMWRVETAKMRAQARVRVMVLACLVGPLLFVLVESAQSGTPADTLFGRWIHESGFADSLLTLGFSTEWLMPLVIVGVAGDMFAEEDRLHTWNLLLTRSRSRQEVLAGKFLAICTYSLAVTVLLGLSATLSGARDRGHSAVGEPRRDRPGLVYRLGCHCRELGNGIGAGASHHGDRGTGVGDQPQQLGRRNRPVGHDLSP